jgi:hypothetical protein
VPAESNLSPQVRLWVISYDFKVKFLELTSHVLDSGVGGVIQDSTGDVDCPPSDPLGLGSPASLPQACSMLAQVLCSVLTHTAWGRLSSRVHLSPGREEWGKGKGSCGQSVQASVLQTTGRSLAQTKWAGEG